jgi:hypothetical protein
VTYERLAEERNSRNQVRWLCWLLGHRWVSGMVERKWAPVIDGVRVGSPIEEFRGRLCRRCATIERYVGTARGVA